MLTNGAAEWESSREEFNIGLTKFALINLERKKLDTNGFNRFMLSQALTYGYDDDRWWEAVADPRKRLSISANLLRKENEVIAGRVLAHLVSDAEFLKSARGLPETMAKSFLGVGTRTNDPVLRQQIFTGLRALVRPRRVIAVRCFWSAGVKANGLPGISSAYLICYKISLPLY